MKRNLGEKFCCRCSVAMTIAALCLLARPTQISAMESAHSDDMSDQCWSTYKVGAWATLVSDSQRPGSGAAVVSHMEMTNTVKAVSADSLTIETVSNTSMRAVKSGQVMKGRPSGMTITTNRHDAHPKTQWVGEEDVQAMGRTFQTQIYTMPDIGGKSYVSTEVPGCMVKMGMPTIGTDPPVILVLSAFGWR